MQAAAGFHRAAKRLRAEGQAGGEALQAGEEEEEEAAGSRSSGGKVSLASQTVVSLQDAVEDSHRTPPSPVVHVRALCEAAVEADLVEALGKFGNICYVMMMPFKRQALVEFDSVESAERCVQLGAREAVCVAEQQVFFNFSTSQRISRPTNTDDPAGGNKVLLLSIQNPLYPITTDVLYSVFNPVVSVLRIVIFKRNGIQAMLEFESAADAQKAKLSLNGADIYCGCCTLKIEHARPNRLNVVRNDSSSSWDYSEQRERRKGRQRHAILGQHPSTGPLRPLLAPPFTCRRSSEEVQDMMSYPSLLSQTSSLQGHAASSSVAMATGLHPAKMNCSRVFNLFCLYGNVEKVRFLRSVPGAALVMMADAFAVDRAVIHLNGIKVFGKKLNVCVSRQQEVFPHQDCDLPDGSSSFQDFSRSRNNRFSVSPGGRNVIQPPGAVLHFYNAPPTLSRQQLLQLCSDHGAPTFDKFRVFEGKRSRTVSGLVEFGSSSSAVEALMLLNHRPIRTPGCCSPFTLKLCFSTASRL